MDAMNSEPTASPERLKDLAASVPFWWHSIDLGGFTTPGARSARALKRQLRSLHLPDLEGKTVLDIGTYDGFFAFEAERRGARRVVALDHWVWSLDLPAHVAYWKACRDRGIVPEPYDETPHWRPEDLPGKRAYDVAHAALGSRVETVVGDFMTMDLETLGMFDVVLYLGVLYHMENPFEALKRVAKVTEGVAVIETQAIVFSSQRKKALFEFFESNELNNDVSNWWAPNQRALEGMSRASGFHRVETVKRPRNLAVRLAKSGVAALRRSTPGTGGGRHYRAVAHAFKRDL